MEKVRKISGITIRKEQVERNKKNNKSKYCWHNCQCFTCSI